MIRYILPLVVSAVCATASMASNPNVFIEYDEHSHCLNSLKFQVNYKDGYPPCPTDDINIPDEIKSIALEIYDGPPSLGVKQPIFSQALNDMMKDIKAIEILPITKEDNLNNYHYQVNPCYCVLPEGGISKLKIKVFVSRSCDVDANKEPQVNFLVNPRVNLVAAIKYYPSDIEKQ